MHSTVTRKATPWLTDRGVKVMCIEVWGWDKGLDAMIEDVRKEKKEKFWATNYAGRERVYWDIENLTILGQIPRSLGFKWPPLRHHRKGRGRAVAII